VLFRSGVASSSVDSKYVTSDELAFAGETFFSLLEELISCAKPKVVWKRTNRRERTTKATIYFVFAIIIPRWN
jgi:hypothetical protein